MIKEYIYIDEKRILSYFEQISDPLKNEKSTSFKFSFGFPKLSFDSELKNEKRPFTLIEKINIINDYLSKLNIDHNGSIFKSLAYYNPSEDNRPFPSSLFGNGYQFAKVLE